MRKLMLWFLAALLMTACGGCSAIDDKVDPRQRDIPVESIIYINIIKQK
jgi:hypothetical protein